MKHIFVSFPWKLWQTKMSPVRRWAIEQLQITDGLNVVVSGQGWPNYENNRSFHYNLTKIMPGCDLVWWYKPEGSRGIESLNKPEERWCPALSTYNEAWWPDKKALKECQRTRTDYVVCHHFNDVKQFETGNDDFQPNVKHIEHCVPEELFVGHSKNWKDRDEQFVMTGTITDVYYPHRTRIANLIRNGFLPGRIQSYPGYTLKDVAECRRQEVSYANLLGNIKVMPVCSSKYRYGLAKYIEGAMSGCILFGDCPPEFENTIGKHMQIVEPNESDENIRSKLFLALDNEEHWSKQSMLVQQCARDNYRMDQYVQRVLDFVGW